MRSALEAEGFGRDSIDLRSGEQLIGQSQSERSDESGDGFWAGVSDDGLRGISATDVLIAVEVDDDTAQSKRRLWTCANSRYFGDCTEPA